MTCKCGKPGAVRAWSCGCGNDCERTVKCPQRQPKGRRGRCQQCYDATRRERYKSRFGGGRKREHSPMLDARPFARWLEFALAEYGTLDSLALYCDMNATGLSRIISGQYQKVQLDTVDKALCRLGSPNMLRELYPALYEFTPEQMVEAEMWAYGY